MRTSHNSLINFIRKNSLWIVLTAGLVGFDIFTKLLAEKNLAHGPVKIIDRIFSLSLSYNRGVAFSIPIPNAVMIFATPLLIGVLIFFITKYCRLESPLTKLCIVLFLAGALGNLINRLWLGAVIDFIAFSFWPSFNLADSYLTIAAFLMIAFYGRIMLTPHHG